LAKARVDPVRKELRLRKERQTAKTEETQKCQRELRDAGPETKR